MEMTLPRADQNEAHTNLEDRKVEILEICVPFMNLSTGQGSVCRGF